MKKKNNLKKLCCVILALVMLLGLMAGCSSKNPQSSSSSESGEKSYKVAIVQLVDNNAFKEMIEAFEGKMRSLGYTEDKMKFEIKNAQGDMSTLNTICAELKNSDYDLIVPIVTPATQAVVNQNLKAPVVFISVTDPVGAGIMSALDTPDKNATGTSNIVPVDQIFSLAQKLTPGIKNIGVLYCSGEKNAVQTVAKAKTFFDGNGYTYKETTVASSAEVQQAAQSLAASGVDAIYVPIDSTVQSAMAQVVEAANKAGIPVYGSDPVMVQSGALACVSVSNTQLGQRSAEMANEILKGKAVSAIPAEAMSTYNYVVSKAAADALKITLPDDGSVIVIGG